MEGRGRGRQDGGGGALRGDHELGHGGLGVAVPGALVHPCSEETEPGKRAYVRAVSTEHETYMERGGRGAPDACRRGQRLVAGTWKDSRVLPNLLRIFLLFLIVVVVPVVLHGFRHALLRHTRPCLIAVQSASGQDAVNSCLLPLESPRSPACPPQTSAGAMRIEPRSRGQCSRQRQRRRARHQRYPRGEERFSGVPRGIAAAADDRLLRSATPTETCTQSRVKAA